MSDKSIFGLEEKYASVFCYLGFFVTGLVAYVLEPNNKKVRFYALQSFIYFGILMAARWVLNIFGFIAFFTVPILNLVILVSWLFLIYTAYKGILFKVPIIGDVVYNQVYNG